MKAIIASALYRPEKVLKDKEKDYLCFVGRIRSDKYSNTVLDITESKSNYEIVHCHYMKEEGLKKVNKRNIEV